ncbi:hypothetical protein [Arthrobacter sp. K5]|jgi:hypothetical protein|uniref:DUF222 domain-containing protein n=1 Tax=Arthrobacter sp. K5 TaxID=2839623 RepID=A0AAU8EQJ7_9MICC
MSTTPAPVDAIHLALCTAAEDPSIPLDGEWTARQLQALAEMDKRVQRHPQHMLARMALANHGNTPSLEPIRASVVRSLGGAAGTHYIVAALHLAHLAMALPHVLSATQRALLLAPLKAAEMAREATDNDSAEVEFAA